MTNRGTATLIYDYENRLTQVISGTTTSIYTYNGDGARVKKEVSTAGVTTTTYYVGNYYEVTGGNATKYYYFGGTRVAMKQGSAGTYVVTYLYGEHLGSTSAASTDGVISKQTYYAYGAVRTTDGTLPTDYTFTGQKVDASDTLMYYNARYYDATIGRFIQPDSIVPNIHDPQSLNRYAYVRNNPVKNTDPTGHRECGDGESCDDGTPGDYRYISEGRNKDDTVTQVDPDRGDDGGGGKPGNGNAGSNNYNPIDYFQNFRIGLGNTTVVFDHQFVLNTFFFDGSLRVRGALNYGGTNAPLTINNDSMSYTNPLGQQFTFSGVPGIGVRLPPTNVVDTDQATVSYAGQYGLTSAGPNSIQIGGGSTTIITTKPDSEGHTSKSQISITGVEDLHPGNAALVAVPLLAGYGVYSASNMDWSPSPNLGW